jgi:hypothetical protein
MKSMAIYVVVTFLSAALAGCASSRHYVDDDEDDVDMEDLRAQRREQGNANLALLAGVIAGMQPRTGVRAPVFVPPPVYRPSPAPQPQQVAQRKPTVNDCISVRTNQWGSREFYNQCGFTVGISWCNEDPESPYFCKSGISGRGMDFIGAGKATGGVGKSGRAHWAACQGGASSGNYPTLKDGMATCR